MAYNEKKQLYNDIMQSVARELKRQLSESMLDDVGERPSDAANRVADESWKRAIDDAVYTLMSYKVPDLDLEKYIAIWKPENNKQFKNAIAASITMFGVNCSLNWIDTSEITDMSNLFSYSLFNGDISKWNTSKVRLMKNMFINARKFDGDISKWDVSSVYDMEGMFFCATGFKDCSLNDWDVSNVVNMNSMFYECPYNKPLDKWNVSSVQNMCDMFKYSEFDQDISMWDVSSVNLNWGIFASCKIKNEYRPKFERN